MKWGIMQIKKIKTSILRIVLLGSIGVLYTIMSFFISKSGPETIVTIPNGAYASSIADILQEEGLLKRPWKFKLYIRLSGLGNKLQSGSFIVHQGDSIYRLGKTLTGVDAERYLIKVVIPEGFSLRKIGKRLVSLGLTTEKEYYVTLDKLKHRFASEYPFLRETPSSFIEGYLFPNTYYIEKGAPLESIMHQCLKGFSQSIVPLWQEYGKQDKGSFHDVLTMASLIEKEARDPREMPTIASVFYNRLKKRMRLASDPTVLYALGEPDKKRVLYRDLEVKSPYNTYRNRGLPPTPIASPGVAAFKAALYPADTEYYFFVANNDGTHHFTRTFKEHSAAIRRIRKSKPTKRPLEER